MQINEKIKLKELEPSDAELIFNTINSERDYLREWLPFVDETIRIDDSIAFVDFAMKNATEKQEYVYSIFYENDFAGIIGYKNFDTENRAIEIGYWLSEKFQKKGIIIQSCQALIKQAFEGMNVNTVIINVAVANEKSRKIPEKLSFTINKIIKDGELLVSGYTDIVEYVLLKENFFI